MNKGFTLLEMILYIALSGILMTGLVQSMYQILSVATVSEREVEIINEGNFIVQTITSTLRNGSTVSETDIVNEIKKLSSSAVENITVTRTTVEGNLVLIEVHFMIINEPFILKRYLFL